MKTRVFIFVIILLILTLSGCDYKLRFDEKSENEMINKTISTLEDMKNNDTYQFTLQYDDVELHAFKYEDVKLFVETTENYDKYYYDGYLYTYDKEKDSTEKVVYEFEQLNTNDIYNSLIDVLIEAVANTSGKYGMYTWFPSSGRSWITRELDSIKIDINSNEVTIITECLYYDFDAEKNLHDISSYSMQLMVNAQISLDEATITTQYLPEDMEKRVLDDLGINRHEINRKTVKYESYLFFFSFLLIYIISFLIVRKKIKSFRPSYIFLFFFSHILSIISYILGVVFLFDHFTLTVRFGLLLQWFLTVSVVTTSVNTLLTFALLQYERHLRHNTRLRLTFASSVTFIMILVMFSILAFILSLLQ